MVFQSKNLKKETNIKCDNNIKLKMIKKHLYVKYASLYLHFYYVYLLILIMFIFDDYYDIMFKRYNRCRIIHLLIIIYKEILCQDLIFVK